MANNAIIQLWGKQVGAVSWMEAENTAYFEFDPAFLSQPWDIAPLTMPLESARGRIYRFPELSRPESSFRGLPGLLADMLPDKYGNALINAWLASQGRGQYGINPVETLCFIGSRSMGALEIAPAFRNEEEKSRKIEIEGIISIANKILNSRKQFHADLKADEQSALTDILKIGTSAGGARAKAVIAFNDKTKEVRSGQVNLPKGFKHWMIKFDGVSDNQFGASYGYGRVEMAYHLMARDAGIEMTACRLLEENGRAHFMTRRFDRDDSGNKIHMQSLHAMRHFDFNMVGYFAYEQMFETMRLLGLPYPQAEQMFRRMVFNVLAKNCDDHTKNFAFLMNNKGEWNLAPAFDICHAFRPGSDWVSMQSMTVNGKRENIETADFLQLARMMNIKNARDLIEQVKSTVKKWNHYAQMVDVDDKLRKAIEKTLLK